MSRQDDRRGDAPQESRDRGLITHVSAEERWAASMRSQPAKARRRGIWRRLLLGERPEPIAAHRGPVQTPGSTGICCSGGGIRSAAFNLGALQALQSKGRLQQADYLAGVSGGSYVAAAFCMVGKTSTDPDGDDSDPRLIAQSPPFEPGSPEEQYLRNRSSYMAPDAAAKAYLGLRLVLGMAVNLIFLALPVVGVAILAGVFFYMPHFGELRNGVHNPTDLAWILPAAVALAGILVGALRVLRRCPTDDCRRFSETWAIRFLGLAALIAIVTLALPELVGLGLENQTATPDAVPDVENEGVAQATSGAGVAGLIAGLLASLRQVFATPKNFVAGVRSARGWAQRLNSGTRKLLVHTAALIAGPMLLATIAVVALTTTARYLPTDDGKLWLCVAAGGALALFALLYRWADLTTWSLHPFYKRRLNTAFALKRVLPQDEPSLLRRSAIAQESVEGVAVERNFDRHVPLSETACASGPTLLVCAAANISDPGATPAGRRVTSFTFSAQTIGGPLVGGLQTRTFEQAFGSRRQRDFTLPAAVAMSGAALAPSMGKTGNRSWRFLMTLANIRLGVWVPNPRWVAGTELSGHDRQRRRYKRPRPWYLLAELLGLNRVDAKYLYVTDGGHYENLGLVELLRRGCTNVYCFDASGGQTFAELGDAVALARSELGVEIAIDPTPLMPAGDPPTAQVAVVEGKITYPSREIGRLVYARNVVSPGTPWDVLAHQRKDPKFPHDSTADQLYTDQKFEAYRALGERAGRQALDLMDAVPPSAGSSNNGASGQPAEAVHA